MAGNYRLQEQKMEKIKSVIEEFQKYFDLMDGVYKKNFDNMILDFGDDLEEFSIFTKFDYEETANKAYDIFYKFFLALTDIKELSSKKPLLVLKYEKFQEGLKLIQGSFCDYSDYELEKATSRLKSDVQARIDANEMGYSDLEFENRYKKEYTTLDELNSKFLEFKQMADNYFKEKIPFGVSIIEKQEEYYKNKTPIQVKANFTNQMLDIINFYQVGIKDQIQKEYLARKVLKYFNLKDEIIS
ncbi:hypothetical protein [Campylobacter fetus]|uniref:hypothetical protein n=1 Tax=Campylobacter fetus TaxID=196 RepID=UPI00138E3F82|nr:hypothetical protein [Campylobacter fetus]